MWLGIVVTSLICVLWAVKFIWKGSRVPYEQVRVFDRSADGMQYEKVIVFDRVAYVHRPAVMRAQAEGRPAAVFVLHGSGGVAADMFGRGFEALADVPFLTVYPEMQHPRATTWGYKDDLPYFSALVQRLQDKDFRVDPARTFVCGHSAGGSMALFLLNEVDHFAAGGAVEAAVGHLDSWNMARRGHPAMIIWNHRDPVLRAYAPEKKEEKYFDLTISTLRRHGSRTFTPQWLPSSWFISFAQIQKYPEDDSPRLWMLHFQNRWPFGTHDWPEKSWCTFSATEELVKFFFEVQRLSASSASNSSSLGGF